jgi:Tfp pilus assembly protein PilN
MFKSTPGPAPTGPTHHLVGDHEYVMTVANGADGLRVSGRSRHDAARRPHDWLENERRDML